MQDNIHCNLDSNHKYLYFYVLLTLVVGNNKLPPKITLYNVQNDEGIIQKVRQAYGMLNPVWKTLNITKYPKLQIFRLGWLKFV